MLNLALYYEDENLFADAIAWYEKAMKAGGDKLFIERGISRCLYRVNRCEEALLILKHSRHIKDSESLYLRSIVLEKLNRLDEAIEDLKLAIAINPKFTDAVLELARVLPSEESELALVYLNNAIQFDEGNPELELERAHRLIKLDKLREAKVLLERIISIVPLNLWANLYLGEICSGFGEYKLAEKYFSIANNIDQSDFTRKRLESLKNKMEQQAGDNV